MRITRLVEQIMLLNDAKMPTLKDKLTEQQAQADKVRDTLEKKDEKVEKIIKKSAKKN